MKKSSSGLANVFRAFSKFIVVIGVGATFLDIVREVAVNVVSDVSSEYVKRQFFEAPASQQVTSTSGNWAIDTGWKDGNWAIDTGWKDGNWAVDTSWDTNWGYDEQGWDAGWGSSKQ